MTALDVVVLRCFFGVLVAFGVVQLIDWIRARLQTAAKPRARDIEGKPFPDVRDYQRDEGDESDIAAEGGFCGSWPGIAAIDAIKRAHPRLSDMQAYAVAVARTRQRTTA